MTASTGSLTNPFQYTGREFDSETGLYSNRARYFDPSAGRFLSQDPIRFSGGTNFYAYVRNNPAVFKDVLGYQGCNASQWAQSPGACGGPTDPNSPYEGSDGLWYNVTEWSPPPPLLPWPPSNDETDSQCECNPWTLAERSEEIWQEETNADEHTVGWGVAKDVGGNALEWILEHTGLKGLAGWVPGLELGFIGSDYYEIWNHRTEAHEKIKKMYEDCGSNAFDD